MPLILKISDVTIAISSEIILETVRNFYNRILLQSTLEGEKLNKVIRKIENVTNNELPLNNKNITIDDLRRTCAGMQFGIWNNRIVITFDLPFTTETKNELYEVKSLPIPQYMKNNTGSLRIKPPTKYLLVEGDKYYNTGEEDFIRCWNNRQYIICPQRWLTFNKQTSC